MSYVDIEGVRHPDFADPVTAEGLEHIGRCERCLAMFDHPYIRSMVARAEFSDDHLHCGTPDVPVAHRPEPKIVRKWWQFWR